MTRQLCNFPPCQKCFCDNAHMLPWLRIVTGTQASLDNKVYACCNSAAA